MPRSLSELRAGRPPGAAFGVRGLVTAFFAWPTGLRLRLAKMVSESPPTRTPTALHLPAQGWREERAPTLGESQKFPPTLKGLHRFGLGPRLQPFQGCEMVDCAPRVAPLAQPWAEGWNALGVLTTFDGDKSPHSKAPSARRSEFSKSSKARNAWMDLMCRAKWEILRP